MVGYSHLHPAGSCRAQYCEQVGNHFERHPSGRNPPLAAAVLLVLQLIGLLEILLGCVWAFAPLAESGFGILLIIPVVLVLWWGKENACIEWGKWFRRKTTSDTRTVKNTNRELAHGRITKKGEFDQRYNTVIRVTESGTRHRKFKCSACDHVWKLDEPYEESHHESP